MTPRTFWILLLRFLGLWILLDIFTYVSTTFNNLVYYWQQKDTHSLVITLGLTLLVAGMYILLIQVLIFRTTWLIDKWNLDKDIADERIADNIHRSTIIHIATILIGAFMCIDSIPYLIQNLFIYAQQRSGNIDVGNNSATPWVFFYFIKSIGGYLLATNSRWVVNFIEKERQKP